MFSKPLAYDFDVEDGAFGCAHGMGEGLKAGGAEIEGEALERAAVGGFLSDVGPGARGVGIRGGPFGMGNLGR